MRLWYDEYLRYVVTIKEKFSLLGLHIQRMPSVQGGIKHVGRMSSFTELEANGVFFVGSATTVITFVEFKPIASSEYTVQAIVKLGKTHT